MRTPLLAVLLVAAPAAADPALDTPISALVDITEVTISGAGGVDLAILRHSFNATIDAALRCYEAVKTKPAKLAATVTLKFRIDDRGAVTKASAVGLPSVNSCLAAEIKALVFDLPDKGGMDVTEKVWFRATPANVGAFASLTGTSELSSGFDDQAVYGGLLGNETSEGTGSFGYGRSGTGPGGASNGTRAMAPMVSIGQVNAQGDLDRAIIRRYTKRNLQKILDCYEKALVNKPTLAGTVQLQFTIAGDGKVTSSSGSGVDPIIARCVADVIQHIEFPKPKNNGVVNVNVPFAFHPPVAGSP